MDRPPSHLTHVLREIDSSVFKDGSLHKEVHKMYGLQICEINESNYNYFFMKSFTTDSKVHNIHFLSIRQTKEKTSITRNSIRY